MFYGFKELRTVFPVSRPTLKRLGLRSFDPFPNRVVIGGRKFWVKEEVDNWLARRAQERERR